MKPEAVGTEPQTVTQREDAAEDSAGAMRQGPNGNPAYPHWTMTANRKSHGRLPERETMTGYFPDADRARPWIALTLAHRLGSLNGITIDVRVDPAQQSLFGGAT